MTFLLVAVVYAVAIGKPSFTETGPLAVGFSLWCSAFVGMALSSSEPLLTCFKLLLHDRAYAATSQYMHLLKQRN